MLHRLYADVRYICCCTTILSYKIVQFCCGQASGLLQLIVELAQRHPSQGTSDLSRLMALRVLAVLGKWRTNRRMTDSMVTHTIFAICSP